MNKLKALLPIVFVMLCITLQAEEKKVKITGNIKGIETNQVLIINKNRETITTGVSENGKFEIEFKVDFNKDIRYYLYIPVLSNGKPQPNSSYQFYADDKGVNMTGKAKGKKIINFNADSPINNNYRKYKYETPSAKARVKAVIETEKAASKYNKFINPDGTMATIQKRQELPKANELQKIEYEALRKHGELSIKCLMEAVDMLTPNHDIALNAFIYSSGKGLKGKLLKPIIEKYRSLYSEEELNQEFYTRDLLKIWRIKAVRVTGEEIPDYDFVDLKGEKVNFADFKGKYIYVNIYDIKFEPSLEELANIQELEKQYKEIVFLHLNYNLDRAAWRKYCKEHNLTGNHINLNDNEGFNRVYRVKKLPRGILIDKELKMHTYMVGKQFGDHDENGKNLFNGITAEALLKEISSK